MRAASSLSHSGKWISLRLSIDSKPLGAFIEYTLKPLIEESRDLLDLMEKHDLKLGATIDYAFKLYIIDALIRAITSITCTGIIAWGALHFLPILK